MSAMSIAIILFVILGLLVSTLPLVAACMLSSLISQERGE